MSETPPPGRSGGNAGEWSGVGWKVGVEPDCFDAEDGLVVSLFVENAEQTLGIGFQEIRETALAELSPMEARSIARVLTMCADYVERARREQA